MPSIGAAEAVLCFGIAVVAFFGPLSALLLILLGRRPCPLCATRIPKAATVCPRCRRDLPPGWASR